MHFQAELWQLGFKHVAGVDEAGRGPLAGPVVAAACVVPADILIEGRHSPDLSTEGHFFVVIHLIRFQC